MLGAAFPLVAVPLAWYVLGVCGSALHPRRESGVDATAVARGAAILILTTWVLTRWFSLPGRAAVMLVAAALAGALIVHGVRGGLRRIVVAERRDLPMLGVATAVMSAWMAPITRHGIGSVGTGNHADLPSYLLQAIHLFDHGFASTTSLPGIAPETRMFDAFGATALLAPTTALPSGPTAGVMVLVALGAVVVAQLVERLAARALGGSRVVPALLAVTLLMSWTFTFNAFAYFLAQVWGLALGLALIALLLDGTERGVAAGLSGALLSVAGVLSYNPTGALYTACALAIGLGLVVAWRAGRRPASGPPAAAALAGIGGGALVFLPVWQEARDRLSDLSVVAAGWPMPTAPLWAAIGLPIAQTGNAMRTIVAGSLALAAVAGAGWLASARGRRAHLYLWPLGLPVALWVQRAWEHPGSYQQWKAFSYAQPLLLLWVGCGVVLLARALTERVGAGRPPRIRAALEQVAVLVLVLVAAINAFWPRDYFRRDGCCIAGREQIVQMQDAADRAPGRVRVNTGYVWTNDLATAIIARSRPVSVAAPTIWPSEPVRPISAVLAFDPGPHPSLIEGRFELRPRGPRSAALEPGSARSRPAPTGFRSRRSASAPGSRPTAPRARGA